MKAPSFYDPNNVAQFRRVNLVNAREEGMAANMKPWTQDKTKRLLVGIDLQNDFVIDGGTLQVQGAKEDMRRFIDYIYNRADEISGLLFTLDKHLPWQIFYSPWWKNKDGEHPAPFTMISEEDVQNGVWIPQLYKKWSREYPTRLKETNQPPLYIWPEHCMIDNDGSSLVADLGEAIQWLSTARAIQPIYVFKGTVPQSEHYGAFRCCVPVPNNPQGGLQTGYLDAIANYDVIDIAGQAEDFCVRETMKQMLEYFGDRQDVLQKMRFLSDCTSLVFPDQRDEADNILDSYAQKGVQIVKSTD